MTYTLEAIRQIHDLPLTTLIYQAQQAHHKHQDPAGVQLCRLQSIKTGACSEDCKYCPQSARYDTFVEAERLMDTERVLGWAKEAKASGASRFCMGASWRDVPSNRQFESVLSTVAAVSGEGLEVCCTMGMMSEEQAVRLKEAGCAVYNHNLDTSPEYYKEVITTRTYEERLQTLQNVRKAGLEVCAGGILGMGESIDDRLELLRQLANLEPQPESVPINALIAVEGTPMEDMPFIDSIAFARVVATARIIMPRAMVRLSAGRAKMSEETQALCFLAGANSLFLGDRLLTTENPGEDDDMRMLGKFGLHAVDPDTCRSYHRASEGSDTYADAPTMTVAQSAGPSA
ncbi:MAG: biotin synthase BioB [Opitutales bacterium]